MLARHGDKSKYLGVKGTVKSKFRQCYYFSSPIRYIGHELAWLSP
jgi:hypothetical protein